MFDTTSVTGLKQLSVIADMATPLQQKLNDTAAYAFAIPKSRKNQRLKEEIDASWLAIAETASQRKRAADDRAHWRAKT
jgi:hypothetical protein